MNFKSLLLLFFFLKFLSSESSISIKYPFITVGYKIPTAEVLSGIDYMTTARRLRPDSYGSRTPPTTTTASRLRPDSYGSRTLSWTTTVGKPRPDSYGSRTWPLTLIAGRLRSYSYGSRASSSTPTAARQTASGLLREPDSTDNFSSEDNSTRTPMGAGLHPQR